MRWLLSINDMQTPLTFSKDAYLVALAIGLSLYGHFHTLQKLMSYRTKDKIIEYFHTFV